jgi:glycosyltransferase involved in cell wall biosynthesis
VSFWDNPFFTQFFVYGYLGLLTVVWLLMLFGLSKWGEKWKVEEPKTPPPERAPSVSICIPARNEAENIADCLTAALQVDWPNLEVLIVDDRSEDATGDIAREIATKDSRLRVVEGSEPPQGWAGKPWTCSRAAKESQGAWLLFIDADVQIHPKAVQAAVSLAKERNIALLSFFGTWIVKNFW